MATLVWDRPDNLSYNFGVSRGVLYAPGTAGVAWNGLISVDESLVSGGIENYYYDGIKYLDYVGSSFYQAKLSAFSAPKEFYGCTGYREIVPGFILAHQPKTRFDLSYRTEDGDGNYKIHLVYGATATPAEKTSSTLGAVVSPLVLSWVIDSVPPKVSGYRPTAHYIFETKNTDRWVVKDIESRLYGSDRADPYMPSPSELTSILANPITDIVNDTV